MKIFTNLKTIFSLTALAAILLAGCDDEDGENIDNTPPTITVNSPSDDSSLEAGDAVVFDAVFDDNAELSQFNIEIHENFDGHSHGRIANDPSLAKYSFKQNFDIPGGTSYQARLDEEIVISSDAMAGPYHFIVQAVDATGNSTSFQDGSTAEIEVFITNDSQAKIEITNLENDELEIEVGVPFMVEGSVSDPTTTGDYAGIDEIEIVLGEAHEEHDHDHSRLAEEDFIDVDMNEETMTDYMVEGKLSLDKVFQEVNFTLSQTQLDELKAEEIDHLELSITVWDKQGNISVSTTEVHIHQE